VKEMTTSCIAYARSHSKRFTSLRRYSWRENIKYQLQQGETMVECDQCNNWYHPACVKLPEIPEGSYICPTCQEGSVSIISFFIALDSKHLCVFITANAKKLENQKFEAYAKKYTPMTKKELREELGRRGLIKKVTS